MTPGNECGCKKIGCNAETWTNAFMDCSSPFSLRRIIAPGFAKHAGCVRIATVGRCDLCDAGLTDLAESMACERARPARWQVSCATSAVSDAEKTLEGYNDTVRQEPERLTL